MLIILFKLLGSIAGENNMSTSAEKELNAKKESIASDVNSIVNQVKIYAFISEKLQKNKGYIYSNLNINPELIENLLEDFEVLRAGKAVKLYQTIFSKDKNNNVVINPQDISKLEKELELYHQNSANNNDMILRVLKSLYDISEKKEKQISLTGTEKEILSHFHYLSTCFERYRNEEIFLNQDTSQKVKGANTILTPQEREALIERV